MLSQKSSNNQKGETRAQRFPHTQPIVENVNAHLRKDGNTPDGNSPLKSLGLLLAVPVLYALSIPLNILSIPYVLATGKKKNTVPNLNADLLPIPEVTKVIPRNERKYDLILFGVTGFTGKKAAKYAFDKYSDLKIGFAGRSKEKVLKSLQETGVDSSKFDVIVADSRNMDDMLSLSANTRAIASFVGPFIQYGTPLVRACIANQTHYCDSTGETEIWVARLVDEYHLKAVENKTKIVNSCGHDSIPWDILTYMAHEEGKELEYVDFYDNVKASGSGGTIATIKASVSHLISSGTKVDYKCGYPPLYMINDGSKSKCKSKSANRAAPGYSRGRPVGWFLMADTNHQVIRRSNALIGYGNKLKYSEAREYSGFWGMVSGYLALAVIGAILSWPNLVQGKILPQPGEGPAQKELDQFYLFIDCFYKHKEEAQEKRAQLYYKKDAGYIETAKMVVETGILISKEESDYEGGGVISTACLGSPLLERLVNAGDISFHSNL